MMGQGTEAGPICLLSFLYIEIRLLLYVALTLIIIPLLKILVDYLLHLEHI
jgi:hypothetical protein